MKSKEYKRLLKVRGGCEFERYVKLNELLDEMLLNVGKPEEKLKRLEAWICELEGENNMSAVFYGIASIAYVLLICGIELIELDSWAKAFLSNLLMLMAGILAIMLLSVFGKKYEKKGFVVTALKIRHEKFVEEIKRTGQQTENSGTYVVTVNKQ